MFRTTVWERIDAAQQDDPAAVEAFVARYRAPLLTYVRRWQIAGIEPEDLVQEVFVELFPKQALGRAQPERGSFRGFLLGVARNVALRALKRGRAEKRGAGEVPHGLPEEGVPASAPSDADFERIWCEHLLLRALGALAEHNPRQREALQRRFDRGESYEAIGEAMGRTLQQVKNDLHRGRQFLKDAVREGIADYASSDAELEAEFEAMRRFVGLFGD